MGAVLALLAAFGPAAGQAQPPPRAADEGFLLESPARSLLARQQTGWLEWLTACNAGDAEAAQEAIEEIRSYAALVGMSRLPDLSVAAAARGLEFAREGDFDRARWGLAAAEALDPGRPETALAAASVAWRQGRYLAAGASYLLAHLRPFGLPLARRVATYKLTVWLLAVFVLAGLVLVGIFTAARGSAVYRDLTHILGRALPPLLSHVLAVALLLWPLLLPHGLVWTAVYWSVLLFVQARLGTRVVLALLWLVLIGLPLLAGEPRRRLELALFAPVRAVENVEARRLEGDLFADLGVLQAVLPQSAAAKHLLADLHRMLGQWQAARTLWIEVVEQEPTNVAALNDLGVYHYQVSDFKRALEHFQRASQAGESAAAWFNLSRTFSELYRFNESETALRRARAVDSDAVTAWIGMEAEAPVIALGEGLNRAQEIRAELARSWRQTRPEAGWLQQLWRGALSLALVLVFFAVALLVRLLGRRAGSRWERRIEPWTAGRLEVWRRTLLPGLPEAEAGRPGAALGAVLTAVVFLTLPFVDGLGYQMPWAFDPGPAPLQAVAAAGLIIYLLLRLRRQLGA